MSKSFGRRQSIRANRGFRVKRIALHTYTFMLYIFGRTRRAFCRPNKNKILFFSNARSLMWVTSIFSLPRPLCHSSTDFMRRCRPKSFRDVENRCCFVTSPRANLRGLEVIFVSTAKCDRLSRTDGSGGQSYCFSNADTGGTVGQQSYVEYKFVRATNNR